MTNKTLTRAELIADLELTLSELGYTLEEFVELKGDEMEDWDVQGLWFMFHDEALSWMNDRKPAAA